MKTAPLNLFFWAITLFISLSFGIVQDSSDPYDEIRDAIANGDARKLATHFYTTINLSVPGKEGTFSKVQAELIIKDFFDKHKPQSFKIDHHGSSNDGSRYAIGTLQSTANYRVYFLIKQTEEKFLIHQLDIEEE